VVYAIKLEVSIHVAFLGMFLDLDFFPRVDGCTKEAVHIGEIRPEIVFFPIRWINEDYQ
jgi:hypothetical protein